jgi:N-methylhydantoinase B
VRFKLTHGSAKMTVLGDREKFPPFGLFGGGAAVPQRIILNAGTAQEENVGMRAQGKVVVAGDEITILSAGGGGLGDPLEREPEAVIQDYRDGYLSAASARQQYGVVIDEVTAEVDREQTAKVRAEMHALQT